MKLTRKTAIAIIAIMIAACGTAKKSKTTVVPPFDPSTATVPTVPAVPPVIEKPANGIYAPGAEELAALRQQYPDATMEKLQEGHLLYTESACVKCHEAKNIYVYNEVSWKNIIDDMAIKARISDEEKDAVFKYVLAIKAAEGK